MRREKRQNYNAARVGPLLVERIRELGYEVKIREYSAPIVWAELVGPQIAAATEVGNVRDGVLYVHTRSAMWSHELTFHKQDILHRLNVRIGAPAGQKVITDVRFMNKGGPRQSRKVTLKGPSLHPSREELDDVDLSAQEMANIDFAIALISDTELRAKVRRVRMADVRLRTWRLDNGWGPCPRCQQVAPPAASGSSAVDCPRCRVIAAYPQAT